MERDFHHPYEPYEIQKEFMAALYNCIEDRKIGILESPTGTGKSLSVICGSLTWLRDHKRKRFQDDFVLEAAGEDEPEWMLRHAREEKVRAALAHRSEKEARLARIRTQEERVVERFLEEPQQKKRRLNNGETTVEPDDETSYMLDDYESEDDEGAKAKSSVKGDSGLSAETRALMKKLGMPIGQQKPQEELEDEEELKIFYCSRTHSQLTQFVAELRRVILPPSIAPELLTIATKPDQESVPIEEKLKHVTLGSRKNLCINPKVAKLGNVVAMNERCLELQQPGTPADQKCPFLPTDQSKALVNDFRDHALAKIRDIEDLGALGKKLGVCPYYASRSTVKPSEIVTLPYSLLLQKSAREALQLSLKGHIVIIDEAHNLMDAIIGIHSISVSSQQLKEARIQLLLYLQKFRNRLKGKNRLYVTQIVRVLDSLIGYLQIQAVNAGGSKNSVDIGDLLSGKGVDQINLYKLMRYLGESKLARKVEGYTQLTEKQSRLDAAAQRNSKTISREQISSTPVLMHIQNFLLPLTNPASEGRFFLDKGTDGDEVTLRYMLLDPTEQFREVVEDARAVVLVGGTMSPMTDYINHLFSWFPPERIMTLSCGHVIPPSNLFTCPVTRGLDGSEFDFTFEKRNNDSTVRKSSFKSSSLRFTLVYRKATVPTSLVHSTHSSQISQLGRAIIEVVASAPDGVVVFFTSYAYLSQVFDRWRVVPGYHDQPLGPSIYARLENLKPIFQEAQSTSVDDILSSYASSITNGHGGLLLSVVGGKLSEGINFSDKLGRCVILVGIPYPNPHTAEWRAKSVYIVDKAVKAGKTEQQGKAEAREFYENKAMRAVNQSVGRAIRHKDDWASILLFDRRFAGERAKSKLPGWIKGGMANQREGVDGWADVMKNLRGFFAAKQHS